jgi:hypothetical protein
MSAMRERQTGEVDARVVLGGKLGPTKSAAPDGSRAVAWYSGRIPGVVEEALLTIKRGQPIYLCGAFGGAAAAIAALLEGGTCGELTWDFQKQAPFSAEMRDLYNQRRISFWDYAAITDFLAKTGIAGIALHNGLDEEQNRELFRCRDLDRLTTLILTGLSSLPPAALSGGAGAR